MSQNRELVIFYIKYKLSQRNYPLNHNGLIVEPPSRTDGQFGSPQSNGTFNGASPGTPPASSLHHQALTSSLDAVKEALRDTGNEFELRYTCAFSDLHNQLHITPATAYQSFENVMDEVFRDGVNWGRIVGLFAFGGALCVECVEKEMNPLVGRIIEWMTVYLDNHIQPWIQSQGGWVSLSSTLKFKDTHHLCSLLLRMMKTKNLKRLDIDCCWRPGGQGSPQSDQKGSSVGGRLMSTVCLGLGARLGRVVVLGSRNILRVPRDLTGS